MASDLFGDPGDGVHDGGPDYPRMALIEAKSNYISYRKHTVGSWFHEGGWYGDTDGQVADTGVQRQLKEQDIEKVRSMAG